MSKTLRLLPWVLLLAGCTTSVAIGRTRDEGLDEGAVDLGLDGGPPLPRIDFALLDRGVDVGPPDVGVDFGPPDLGVDAGVDQGPRACTLHRVASCTGSHPEIDCDHFLDGAETAPFCPTGTLETITCRESDGDVLDNSYCLPCPGEDGCLQPFWFRFDLGSPRRVNELRFISGWWRDRPEVYELWYADTPLDDPEVGGTRVDAWDAELHPWACVTGEPCSEEVPDGCCPDGRSQPQVTDQRSTRGCDLGTRFPKYDIARFPETTARYWWLYVRSTNYLDRVFFHEVELRYCR